MSVVNRIFICRLELWLISNNLCDFVNSTDVIPAIRTDHPAISPNLREIGEAKGPGMWKMNVSLLDEEEYLNYLSVNIPKWKSEWERELADKRFKTISLQEMTESQLSSTKTIGILFVNFSLIVLTSPLQRKKFPIPKASCHYCSRKTRERSHALNGT